MPVYLDQDQAREMLAEMGVAISARQLRRAAEPDAHGRRRLPFFRDPIDGRLKIDRDTLRRLYFDRQAAAENTCSALQDFNLH